ncbi:MULTISPECIES: hypothetical protein [Pseudomonas]|uniref:hypothetical protein n=1 Tax=Pseudomonas TaxID=286 RepID=UPI0007B3E754|nr:MULTISPECIES: hypothetical protein [Pseudomonas]AZC54179.1 hypothetical protein C4K35_6641 [Pseudomonas chlororaphis subsp. piscium]AZC60506.1 hypothetical protein C4K34_6386 [Pseudomonas chlororaphis subsp. piscium]AZC66656.1 hypothetical protein C4K33_6209 [Pseudomonas chlororaphis subsp. piscium]AZC72917.1 hypothetical protein C4K32_6300 [Pseudomonas chlororaphis subsp. piscium]AZC79128.1 hypothetical protein C4K31_6270 [Pseudomonas chlororaphis subsp. piscium]
MLLKNLATAPFGLVFSLKDKDKELYSADLTRIENSKKTQGNEKSSYKICTGYLANDYFAFDVAAISPTRQKTVIFGSQTAPCKLENLNLPSSEKYVFSAALELVPKSLTSTPEKNA